MMPGRSRWHNAPINAWDPRWDRHIRRRWRLERTGRGLLRIAHSILHGYVVYGQAYGQAMSGLPPRTSSIAAAPPEQVP
jgi:hypothetical protein